MVESTRASAQPRLSVAIVQPAFIRIAQHVVRLGDRLELLFGFLRAGVAIRVARHRLLAIRRLYLELPRPTCNTERLVKISHDSLCSPSRGPSPAPTCALRAKSLCRTAWESDRSH